MRLNGRAVGLVASVATAAVLVTTALVSRHVPQLQAGAASAAPIPNSTPAPVTPTAKTPPAQATTTPARPSTPLPTTKPSRPSQPPVTITIDPAKLDRGEAPKIPYADGRTLIGGDLKVTIASGHVSEVVRAGKGLMAVVGLTDNVTELHAFDSAGRQTMTVPNVASLESSADFTTTAYATSVVSDLGNYEKGSTVSWRNNTSGRTAALSRPDDYETEILLVQDQVVYFASKSSPRSSRSLYMWWTGNAKPTKVGTVPAPTAVSTYGTQAATLVSQTDTGSCTAVVDTTNGRRYWRTCEYQVDRFSADSRIVLAGPAYRDGYADGLVAVLDNANGRLIRQWKGTWFMKAAIEDSAHVLFVAEQGTKGAIVRCAISTGACELATPFIEGVSDHAIGNPYRLG